jgi:DNA (cytosine-5)-methyltransferase 1
MKYLSVCSGIEAASVAWHPLGWEPFAFAEIEKFPSAVLAHHYPSVPNFGDMTKFKDWPDATIDVLVGGTPCQSFSVAGLRKGLADPRGNLCLTFLAIADRYRPQWVLWENVPGVLSSDGGRDFGAFLGGLGQLGYGWSYRVLDAQYVRVDGFGRAVPQRRRRVFVVGNSRDWRRAAAVLFERESLHGNTAPRRQAGERVAPTISSRPTGGGGLGTDFDCDGGLIDYVPDIVPQAMSSKWSKGSSGPAGDEVANLVAHALRADGFDASEDGTGRGTPLVPIAYSAMPMNSGKDFVVRETDVAQPIMAAGPSLGNQGGDYIHQNWAVRRLTPRECERLQGFPDDYTLVPSRGKPAADGPRYKALGNSMAVNCMRWIGRRIEMVGRLP